MIKTAAGFAGNARIALLAGVAALALPSIAHAQDTPAGDAQESTDSDADNFPDAQDAGTGNEIIVTASKREQTLQDVPIAVSVTSAETIERAQIRDLIDLQTVVPSLRVGQLQSSANTNFIIRGFGNGANNAGIEPSVGVFIDGVYRSRSAAQIGDLPNIQRVEVLRGPQSTLFGKNASAGIISIVTREPQFEFGGSAEISYGNYDAVVVKGDVTGPLSETIAFSLAGNYNRRDGYARYVNLGIDANDRNRWGVRGQLLFEPSDALSVRLIGDYDQIDEICCVVSNFFNNVTSPIPALSPGLAITALGGQINANNPFSYDSFANFPSINDIKNYGFSGQIDFDLTDTLSVTSISAYRAVRSFTNQDSDFTSADLIGDNRANTDIDTYTQELRLASNFDGPLNFLLGGYYFREQIDIASQLLFGKDFRGYANRLSGGQYGATEPLLRALFQIPASTPAFGSAGLGRFENFDYRNSAISIFGQVDFEIVEDLTLTGGFNYTRDRKRVASNNSTTDTFSTLDLVEAGARAGIPGSIPLPTGTIFPRTAPCPTPNTLPAGFCNPFLGFRPLQFLPPFLNFPNAVEDGRTADNDLSYTARINYKIDNRFSTYATYATGFKASSFNLSTDSRPFPTDFIPGSAFQVPAPAASPIRSAGLAVNNLTTGTRFAGPEDATLYEIGFKANVPGLSINAAIFKQVLKGFQSNIFQGTGFVLGNAEKQSTRGFEIESTISPTDLLVFNLAYTHLDPKFDLFTGGSAFNPATNTVVPTNLTGRRPGTPRHNVSAGGTWTVPLSGDNNLILHADYAFTSAVPIAQGLPFKYETESLNASIAVALANGFEVMAWGRNLTEPKYNPVIFPSVAQSGSLSAYPSPPKTYGVSARYRF
jgi:iron complex outermembrane recepter protein